MDEIAKATADFKRKLDKIYYTDLSVEQIFDLCLAKLAELNIPIDYKTLKPFIKKVEKQESKKKSLSFVEGDFLVEKGKKHESEIDLPPRVCIGCAEVFCGCLLCILPYGLTQGLGVTMIGCGANDIWNGLAEENKKEMIVNGVGHNYNGKWGQAKTGSGLG